MFAFLLIVCVGLAGDGWTYSSVESRPKTPRTDARPATATVQPTFTPRPVEKFVEHAPPVQPSPPVPPPKPETTVRPSAQAVTMPAPEPPKPRCRRCGTACGCGEVCPCEANEAKMPPPKRWYVLPEYPALEGYGEVVDRNGIPTLRYETIRPRTGAANEMIGPRAGEASGPIRYVPTPQTTNTYPVYTQAPTIMSGNCSGGSCARPSIGRR